MADMLPISAIADEFVRYIEHLASRVERAVRSVPTDKVYIKPYSYGNSIGHLVLHLTGNLNHYIGSGLAKTGYVRDRPREFSDSNPPSPAEALSNFHDAIALVIRTIQSLDAAGWQSPVEFQPPVQTALGMVLVCTAHLNNHIGQMAYLVRQLGYDTNEPPVW
ncbi:MAG: DinB family protein [Gemmataceae bacterium]